MQSECPSRFLILPIDGAGCNGGCVESSSPLTQLTSSTPSTPPTPPTSSTSVSASCTTIKLHRVGIFNVVEFESIEKAISARINTFDSQFCCPALIKSPSFNTSLMIECNIEVMETTMDYLSGLGLCSISVIAFESRRQPGRVRFFIDYHDGEHFNKCVLPELQTASDPTFIWIICTIPLVDRDYFFRETTMIGKDHLAISFQIDLDRIIDGVDNRTTCMIRNIPNKYTQSMLIEMINETHFGTYDFIYLRMDFQNRCNVGYAFINFINPLSIVSFAERMMGKKWPRFNSDKICQLTYARIQGKEALIGKFRCSKVMMEPPTFRPKIFSSKPDQAGIEEPFPS